MKMINFVKRYKQLLTIEDLAHALCNVNEQGDMLCPTHDQMWDMYFALRTTKEKKMNKEFTVHMLNDDGKKKANTIAAAFDECLEKLKTTCPEGRELSIVKTKLEEAAFFAKKSMANVHENCQQTS
jgi:hypothetical protein